MPQEEKTKEWQGNRRREEQLTQEASARTTTVEERPELMLPGQTRPDIPVSWMMKKMKLKVTLRNKGRKSCR